MLYELTQITTSFLYRGRDASPEYNFTSGAKDLSFLLGLAPITKSQILTLSNISRGRSFILTMPLDCLTYRSVKQGTVTALSLFTERMILPTH